MKRTAEVAKLACPYCGGYYSRVLESDAMTDDSIQRTRLCLACQGRYVTAERTISPPPPPQPARNPHA